MWTLSGMEHNDDMPTNKSAIEKGSDTAWRVKRLLEAWTEDDAQRMEAALADARADLPNVFKYLIVIVGGMVDAIAAASGKSYDEVLPIIWQQLAGRTDEPAAEAMRAAVTAWTVGDDTTAANAVNDSGLLNEADPDALVMHFVATAEMLARQFTETIGQPFSYATDGWWAALGTPDPK